MDQQPSEPAAQTEPRRRSFRQSWWVGGLALVAIVLAVFSIVLNLTPSRVWVERKTTIRAPAPEVFAQVNDFHNWSAWSPWAKPTAAGTSLVEGQPFGPGAVLKWSGDGNVGRGTMMITRSEPHEFIAVRIDFAEPFPRTRKAAFVFQPRGDYTEVGWGMYGRHTFWSKALDVFVDMDEAVGDQFEQGLAEIKAIVESTPQTADRSR